MRTLNVIDESSGDTLGTIARGEDGIIQADETGQAILDQISGGQGWDEQATFDALVEGGWSNGYITVRQSHGEPANVAPAS